MRLLSLLIAATSAVAWSQVGNLQLSTASMNFSAVAGVSLPQSQLVGVTSTGVSLPIAVSVRYFTATEGWLSATADRPSTPSNVTVTVNSAGLEPGVYNGQVLVIASGSQSGLVTVTLTVAATNPNNSLIAANPTSVSLVSSSGQIVQTSVALTSGSAGAVPFQVFANTASGGNWLSFLLASNSTPTSITISANPAGLGQGTYTGTISVAPLSGAPGVAIPVTLTVGASGGVGDLSVSPSTLNFAYQTGGAPPNVQSVYVSYFSGIVSYVATSSATWANLSTGTTGLPPAQTVNGASNNYLNIHINPTALTPGQYSATITISASNGASQTVAVNLIVSGNAILTATPAFLSFSYNPDDGIPPTQTVFITTTSTPLNYTASANSTGWLLVGPQTGTTNETPELSVSINPAGLAQGTYTGNIVVNAGNNSVTVPVTLSVGGSGFNSISAQPRSLNFQAQVGNAGASQTLFLTANTTKNFLVSATSAGGNWLQVTPSSGATPASLNVSISPLVVALSGTYTGNIIITNVSDGTVLTIPVTMTLSGARLAAAPASLNFSLTAGSTATASQTVQLSGLSNTPFTAASNSPWLFVNPPTGGIPGSVEISVSAASLNTGVYSGAVSISAGGNAISVPVTLNVTSSAAPILTPSNLTFQHVTGTNAPAPQTIAVNSTAGAVSFSVSARTQLGGDWLSVQTNTNSTPATLTVSVNPVGLSPGTYRGTITASAFAGSDIRTAEVTLVVTAPRGPVLRSALHAALQEMSAITPGMILQLRGNALGPQSGLNATPTAAGAYETTFNGFRVLFDGVPAPILYLSDTRLDTVVPYSVAGRQATRVVVENSNTRSDALELFVSPDAAPGIFTADGSGRGQAAALNEDGALNSAASPAAPGSVLTFFATGEGLTEPAGQDGRIIVTDLRKPVLPVVVNIGGVPVEVTYAGSAPGLVSGLMQVNVRLNPEVPRGNTVPIELRVGPAPSASGVTVAIR